MYVIGTAGHVDHGKSSLVQALTGTHPDRLKEEIDREMTIELGFAQLELDHDLQVGIIDVPGHKDFIENMLAGIGSIDAVLLVIAADEGVMPQTREHLSIIDLLEIHSGLIVMNKIDLIDNPEWLEMVEMDIRETVQGTILEAAPIVKVSARTGQGLADLKAQIRTILLTKLPKPDLNRPRLPIDRVFTLPGFGTIVTGTLRDGSFKVGEEVSILPGEKSGRIRGIQTHKHKVQKAQPGSRTALNLTGITKNEITRGNVVTRPGEYRVTDLIDAHVRMVIDTPVVLKHNMVLKLFIGTAEVNSQCRLLGTNSIKGGDVGFLQLRLSSPVVCMRGDHFIIRRPSPPGTIGGGTILDAHPEKLYRRFNQETLVNLSQLIKGDLLEIILHTAYRLQAPTIDELISAAGIARSEGLSLVNQGLEQGQLITLSQDENLGKQRVMQTNAWEKVHNTVLSTLGTYHQQNPLKPGMMREALKTSLGMEPKLYDLILNTLSAQGEIILSGVYVYMKSHRVTFSSSQEIKIDNFLVKMTQSLYSPPSYREAQQELGEDLLNALIHTRKVIQVSEEVILAPQAYASMTDFVITHLQAHGEITLAELRDHFNTSRKYALAILENLDKMGLTLRQGDLRILKMRHDH